ncbi:Retinol-binding protein 2 [Camelus dromedarius]|uniref:Retinol-binding protein 2 n=1 Tax=Camelus dromedarius TaxID=9838 RepID=A0A5N4EGZ6_CAMDR|nr:Retinol-binding protein 2 [Camelus dromedarius]
MRKRESSQTRSGHPLGTRKDPGGRRDTKGLDNRNVKTLVIWQSDALVSVQKGEKKNRGSKQRVEGNKQYLELTGQGVMAVRAPTEHALHTPCEKFCTGFGTPPPGPSLSWQSPLEHPDGF